MMLPPVRRFYRPKEFNLGANAAGAPILGTIQTCELDRTRPIEEILIQVTGVISAATLTLTGLDTILGIVRKVRLNRPSGVQAPASTVAVDYRGIGLLEYCLNAGLNLDASTLTSAVLSQAATIAASTTFRITYRVPLVHPAIGEPLRCRSLLPCHTWTQSPTLTLEFEAAANMYTNATAGVISNVAVEIITVCREPDANLTQAVLKQGGYIPMDLIETPFTVGTGIGAEQRFALPLGGSFLNLQFCQYKGGAAVTRDLIDAVTTLGTETKWSLQVAGNTKEEWLWRHLKTVNEYSRPRNGASLTYSPDIGCPAVATSSFQTPASCMLDFISDGINASGQAVTEFGGVLDAQTPLNMGQRIEICGVPANVATNGHTLYIGGHRVWGNLAQYQAIQ